MSLKNKRILITAGPTWVPIDSVRVISNIATGETGILLAEKLQSAGAKVTLVLGPTESCCLNRNIRLVRFKFFDELMGIIKKELKTKNHEIVIHSAAVSDYQPKTAYGKKIKSDRKSWAVNLVATPKIIDLIKKIDRGVFLVGFKFEPKASKDKLISRAKQLYRRAGLDLVVANSQDLNKYRAYLLEDNLLLGAVSNKNKMADSLIGLIERKICQN